MSMPIKDTPILTGDDATRFQEAINNPIPVSKDEYDRAKILFNKIIPIYKRRVPYGNTVGGRTGKR